MQLNMGNKLWTVTHFEPNLTDDIFDESLIRWDLVVKKRRQLKMNHQSESEFETLKWYIDHIGIPFYDPLPFETQRSDHFRIDWVDIQIHEFRKRSKTHWIFYDRGQAAKAWNAALNPHPDSIHAVPPNKSYVLYTIDGKKCHVVDDPPSIQVKFE